MNDKDVKRIRKAMGRYPMFILKKVIHLLSVMENQHISIANLREYIKIVDNYHKKRSRLPLYRPCPKCNEPLLIYNISIPKGRSNVYGYKSRWFCKLCLWEKYETKTIHELREKHKVDPEYMGNDNQDSISVG